MEIYHSSLQKITNDILEGMKSVKKEMQDNYFLIQEWVGDAYVESGIYKSLKQFIIDYTKNRKRWFC